MTEPATDPQSYRPDSYWNPGLMVIANIKGDIRQANAIDRYLEGRLERLPSWYFAESLGQEQVEDVISQSPAWAGGESLPARLIINLGIAGTFGMASIDTPLTPGCRGWLLCLI